MPADTNVVFGHQFASIAGTAPITDPIQTAVFGWLPALLWILIGGVFFCAVQDFAAMYASVKNKGRSIGYIIEKYIGRTGKRLFIVFAVGLVFSKKHKLPRGNQHTGGICFCFNQSGFGCPRRLLLILGVMVAIEGLQKLFGERKSK